MTTDNASNPDGKIKCEIDGAFVHSIQRHIRETHSAEWTLERYQKEYPNAPLLSEKAKNAILRKRKELESSGTTGATTKAPMHQIFGLPADKAVNARKEAIMIDLFDREQMDQDSKDLIPDVDDAYVFDIENTKKTLMALAMNKPLYAFGLHGTGKTTLIEQVAARTNRPMLRVQHTINTEETHILGQWTVRNGETVFALGPLPMAMIHGWIYLADEYDFALPSVCSLYQPVLEGKALVIKEAPSEHRVIKPHPNFRIVGTGNTNGVGDETGLYQGVQMQNAANYSRWGVCIEIGYMDPKVEATVVAGKSHIPMPEAHRIIKYATAVREAFIGSSISSTISPRELINAAQIGAARGGDWREGLLMAFANRLSRADKAACDQFAQRIFGGT
jgi:cobaltochelatase CobS